MATSKAPAAKKKTTKAATPKKKKLAAVPEVEEASPPKVRGSGNTLVVVESPAKAKTINKYLGRDYKVIASMGHVRDLPKSKLGVDVENGFEPRVRGDRGQGKKVVKELKDAAKDADRVFARDRPRPRRRGDRLAPRRGARQRTRSKIQRLMFNEITKKAIHEATRAPAGDRRADGRRAAGAPRARPAGRLQDQPAALGQGPPRPQRRPRAVGRAAAGRAIAKREIERVRARGVLDASTARLAAPVPPEFDAKLLKNDGAEDRARQRGASRRPLLADLEAARPFDGRVGRRRRSASATRAPPFITSKLQQDGPLASPSRRR